MSKLASTCACLLGNEDSCNTALRTLYKGDLDTLFTFLMQWDLDGSSRVLVAAEAPPLQASLPTYAHWKTRKAAGP
jgi:hypothetical protein